MRGTGRLDSAMLLQENFDVRGIGVGINNDECGIALIIALSLAVARDL